MTIVYFLRHSIRDTTVKHEMARKRRITEYLYAK